MLVRPADSARPRHLAESGFSKVVSRLLAGPGDSCDRFTVRMLTIQPGGHTRRDSEPAERVFLVRSGSGECVDGDGFAHEVSPGDVVVVPAWEVFHIQNRGTSDLSLFGIAAQGG